MAAHRATAPAPPLDPEGAGHRHRLADGRGTAGRRCGPASARRVLIQFAAANLIVIGLLVTGSVWAIDEAARDVVLDDARATTEMLGALLIEPNLSDTVLTSDSRALEALDLVVEDQLRAAAVVRVKIWDADQRIVYSDERRLVGRTFARDAEELDVLRSGGTVAACSDLTKPENVYERSQGRLIEVYSRITTPAGEPLLLETYFPYDQIVGRRGEIWLRFAPISIGVLLLLVLTQVPLAHRAIRRIRRSDVERLRLHAQAADAVDGERRRIAGSLHDGVVQDLSAAPLLMWRSIDRLGNGPPAVDVGDSVLADELTAASSAVRQAVTSLRSLLIEIYPPHLASAGLPSALADLVSPLQGKGVRTTVEVPEDLDVPPQAEVLLFRVAQEALRNVAKHASARSVHLGLRQDPGVVVMQIDDDGVGFDPAVVGEDGHLGMQVLTDLAAEAGASLDLMTAPGRGTSLRLEVSLTGRPDRQAGA
jgi:signal transduction histidine kinase